MAEAAIGDTKVSVDKLDGSNWAIWKIQMKHLLLTKGLWGLVDGTEVLRAGATAQQKASFVKRQHKAFSTIVLSISPLSFISSLRLRIFNLHGKHCVITMSEAH